LRQFLITIQLLMCGRGLSADSYADCCWSFQRLFCVLICVISACLVKTGL